MWIRGLTDTDTGEVKPAAAVPFRLRIRVATVPSRMVSGVTRELWCGEGEKRSDLEPAADAYRSEWRGRQFEGESRPMGMARHAQNEVRMICIG